MHATVPSSLHSCWGSKCRCSKHVTYTVMASAPIYFQSLYYHTFQRILFLHSVRIYSSFCKIPAHYLWEGRKEGKPSGFVEKLMMKIQKTGAFKWKNTGGMVPCAFWKWEEEETGRLRCHEYGRWETPEHSARATSIDKLSCLQTTGPSGLRRDMAGTPSFSAIYPLKAALLQYITKLPAQRPDQQFSLLWED